MWEKVVLNLISNALKFTLQGEVKVTLRQAGECAELAVEDTGVGIPSTELPKVFERFHRIEGTAGRSIEGTGIGLALVQELVKLHGGSAAVESELDRGSKFTVRVPFGNTHLPQDRLLNESGRSATALRADKYVEESLRWLDMPQRGGDAAAAERDRTERILLADDNPDMREYIERLLKDRYQVIAVANGGDALRAAMSDPPDLILSDVMMPGMDGFGLLQELRKHPETKTIPVVLVSARAGEESRDEGLGAGADDYLIKPFTARELQARVGAQLSMSRRRKEAEKALQESQATLQSFYDSSPLLMGVVEIDGEAIVPIYCNLATATFFGVELETFAQQTSEMLGISRAVDDEWMANYRESRREGRPVHFEIEHDKEAGSLWLAATVNYLGEGPNQRPRFSYVAEDVTGRKRREEALRRANEELRRANADLEQFAYSASHDLQEPLRQVAIYSQLLEREYGSELEGNASAYLGYCVEGAHRMERLISDLLTYSQATRTSRAKAELVDMNDVLATVRKDIAITIQETGAVIEAEPLPQVYGNRVPFIHVLQNLLSNALKYRSSATPVIRVWAEAEAGFWRFGVRDNGIGIAKEYQEQIFGIFKRLHDRNEYPGTGIGLAICQRVVERHGGRIWVESDVGKGSTFYFTLPDSLR
jgi:PAS domain S-box-containing protein